MPNDQFHLIARRFQELQRQSARWSCPVADCQHQTISQVRLVHHARATHPETTRWADEGTEWKTFLEGASPFSNETSTQRRAQAPSASIPKGAESTTDSLRPMAGDEVQTESVTSQHLSGPAVPGLSKTQLDGPNEWSLAAVYSQSPTRPETPSEVSINPSPSSHSPLAPAPSQSCGCTLGPKSSSSKSHAMHDATANGSLKLCSREGRSSGSDLKIDRARKQSPTHQEKPSGPVQSSTVDSHANGHVNHSRVRRDLVTIVPCDVKDVVGEGPEVLLQPESRPMSPEQLMQELKIIYQGLALIEAKCIQVDHQRLADTHVHQRPKIEHHQWTEIIALHKSLLNRHHDFYVVWQHPNASPHVVACAAQYAMPTRMWRHGVHSFLELLRRHLPASREYLHSFIIFAYSMVTLFYETVPYYKSTWMEYLGDLGRFRMAMENESWAEREIWQGIAQAWYNRALHCAPQHGRLLHHLAVIAPVFSIEQLHFYARSLTCKQPFSNSRNGLSTVLQPVLDGQEMPHLDLNSDETLFIRAHALISTGQFESMAYDECVMQRLLQQGALMRLLNRQSEHATYTPVAIAFANIAGLVEWGCTDASGNSTPLMRYWSKANPDVSTRTTGEAQAAATGSEDFSKDTGKFSLELHLEENLKSEERFRQACYLAFGTLFFALKKPRRASCHTLIHIHLVLLWNLSSIPAVQATLKVLIPWQSIATFLNFHIRLMAPRSDEAIRSPAFLHRLDGNQPLAEDYALAGQAFADDYFPSGFLDPSTDFDEDLHGVELPWMAEARLERIRWLGHRLAAAAMGLTFDSKTGLFDVLSGSTSDYWSTEFRMKKARQSPVKAKPPPPTENGCTTPKRSSASLSAAVVNQMAPPSHAQDASALCTKTSSSLTAEMPCRPRKILKRGEVASSAVMGDFVNST